MSGFFRPSYIFLFLVISSMQLICNYKYLIYILIIIVCQLIFSIQIIFLQKNSAYNTSIRDTYDHSDNTEPFSWISVNVYWLSLSNTCSWRTLNSSNVACLRSQLIPSIYIATDTITYKGEITIATREIYSSIVFSPS